MRHSVFMRCVFEVDDYYFSLRYTLMMMMMVSLIAFDEWFDGQGRDLDALVYFCFSRDVYAMWFSFLEGGEVMRKMVCVNW